MYLTINVGNDTSIISGFETFSPDSLVFSESFATSPLYEYELKKIHEVIDAHTKERKVLGIGIAHTGTIDDKGGVIVGSSHLRDYIGHNMVEDMKRDYNVPVYIENDSLCATIAEAYVGKGKDENLVATLYLSSGIGGSYLKKTGNTYSIFPAEVGHQIIILNGKECVCGQRGCLEAYVGAKSIKSRFLKKQEDIDDLRIWEEIVEYMAVGAANMYNMFYPEIIILTGETLKEIPYVKEALVDKIYSRLRKKARDMVRIAISDFYEMGPSFGALTLIKIKEGGNSVQVIE